MNSKTLYVVDHWIPFPSSEYGGMHVVIASSEREARSLLQAARSDWERDHDDALWSAVDKAIQVPVSADEPSRVVRSFTT